MNNTAEIVPVTGSAKLSFEGEVTKALIAMSRLLANAPKRDAELVQLWTAVLREAGLRPEEIVPAATRLIADPTRQGADFFPTPAVLIRYARPVQDMDAAAELAWQRVKACIRKFGANASLTVADVEGDGACLWALERVGWEKLCLSNVDDEAILRAGFVRLYKVALAEGFTLALLHGGFAKQNGIGNRKLTPAMCGRPDWKQLPAGADQPLPAESFALGDFQALAASVTPPVRERDLALQNTR